MPRQTILMCAPDYFGVSYVINPWMQNQIGKSDPAVARQQWNNLRGHLAQHADIVLQPPQPGLPDLVFTANAGMVFGKTAIISRFRSVERQGEEPFDLQWFKDNGFDIAAWPQDVAFEGAGDALLDRGQQVIWVGNGFRSNAEAPALVEKFLKRKTVALKLIDPRFYHLDTCLCPLEGGWLLYYPQAFDAESQEKIAALVPQSKRIAVNDDDALRFSCNAVDLDRHVFMNDASEDLQKHLRAAGFTPVVTPLGEYLKAGGGAKCLTIKLVEA